MAAAPRTRTAASALAPLVAWPRPLHDLEPPGRSSHVSKGKGPGAGGAACPYESGTCNSQAMSTQFGGLEPLGLGTNHSQPSLRRRRRGGRGPLLWRAGWREPFAVAGVVAGPCPGLARVGRIGRLPTIPLWAVGRAWFTVGRLWVTAAVFKP